MENSLSVQIREALNKYDKIRFSLQYLCKWESIDVEMGELKNEACGPIYDEIITWLNEGAFYDYIMRIEIFYNFSGWFALENQEIELYIVFEGPFEDEYDPVLIEFDDAFILKELKLKPNPKVTENELYVDFSYSENGDFMLSNVYYNNKKIKPNKEQIALLEKRLIALTVSNVPTLSLQFDCEQHWVAEAVDNVLKYKISTSPVKITWSEVYEN